MPNLTWEEISGEFDTAWNYTHDKRVEVGLETGMTRKEYLKSFLKFTLQKVLTEVVGEDRQYPSEAEQREAPENLSEYVGYDHAKAEIRQRIKEMGLEEER